MVYIGSDHRGYELKEAIKAFLAGAGYAFEDVGPASYDKDDDYADFAAAVARKVSEDPEAHRGVVVCGSGHGVDMVANKFRGVRAALGFNRQVALQSREHEDANVLALPSDWLEADGARDIVKVWLEGKFTGEERHRRRLGKLAEIESGNFK